MHCIGGFFYLVSNLIAFSKSKTAITPINKPTTTASHFAKTKTEPAIKIKYADKSAGQPDLLDLFETIQKMMVPYSQNVTWFYLQIPAVRQTW